MAFWPRMCEFFMLLLSVTHASSLPLPKSLEALQNETRSRSLLAEWLDFHEWTVWDDGTKPYMEIQHTGSGGRVETCLQ